MWITRDTLVHGARYTRHISTKLPQLPHTPERACTPLLHFSNKYSIYCKQELTLQTETASIFASPSCIFSESLGMFHTLLSNFFCFEYFDTHSMVAVLRRSHKSNRNLALLLPLTTKMAEVDRLSTSVSITQTYFPPWFSWMLRIIRSPDMLWKREIRLSKRCGVN